MSLTFESLKVIDRLEVGPVTVEPRRTLTFDLELPGAIGAGERLFVSSPAQRLRAEARR